MGSPHEHRSRPVCTRCGVGGARTDQSVGVPHGDHVVGHAAAGCTNPDSRKGAVRRGEQRRRPRWIRNVVLGV